MDNNDELDFKLFFDLNLDILCINNLQGKFESINKGFELTLGYTFEDLKNLNAADLVHPDDYISSTQTLMKAKEGAKFIHFINRIRHKNGEYKIIEWKNYPIDNFMYATGRDITALKQKEKELLTNQRRLNAIIEADSNYIFRISLDRKYTYANERFVQDFFPQYTTKTIIGVAASDFRDNNDIEIISGDPQECIKHIGVNYQIEIKQKLPNGEILYSIWDCICFADSNGLPKEIQMVGVDISKKRTTEFVLKQKKELELMEQMTPITKLWDGILFCPITGKLNHERAESLFTAILKKIANTQAKVFILDIIGIPHLDHRAADYFIKLSKATKLMGCICTISGISPAVAQTLIELNVHIETLNTTSNMKDAIEKALLHTGLQISHLKELK